MSWDDDGKYVFNLDNEIDFMNKNEVHQEIGTLIGETLGVEVFSYNSEVTDLMVKTIKNINAGVFCSDNAKILNISKSHSELMYYLVCNNRCADYGTSPRGCWLIDNGKQLLKNILIAENKMESLP